jgi:hypothetical protein
VSYRTRNGRTFNFSPLHLKVTRKLGHYYCITSLRAMRNLNLWALTAGWRRDSLRIHVRTGRCKRHYLKCSAHRANDDWWLYVLNKMKYCTFKSIFLRHSKISFDNRDVKLGGQFEKKKKKIPRGENMRTVNIMHTCSILHSSGDTFRNSRPWTFS